jgi:hypothetical protein
MANARKTATTSSRIRAYQGMAAKTGGTSVMVMSRPRMATRNQGA